MSAAWGMPAPFTTPPSGAPTTDAVPLLRPREVADLLAVSMDTLAMWRARDVGPAPVRLVGSVIRYRRSALVEWVENRESRDAPEPMDCGYCGFPRAGARAGGPLVRAGRPQGRAAPETPAQAAAWDRRLRQYATVLGCHTCAAQLAYGHSIGFTLLEHAPCASCAPIIATFPQPAAGGWGTLPRDELTWLPARGGTSGAVTPASQVDDPVRTVPEPPLPVPGDPPGASSG